LARPHILVLSSSYPSPTTKEWGSAGIFIQDFCKALLSKYRITVITQQSVTGDIDDTIENNIRVIRFPWKGNKKALSTLHPVYNFFSILSVLFAGYMTTRDYVKQNNVDFIFGAWAVPSGLWALLLKKHYHIPYGVWALGSDIWDYGKKNLLKYVVKSVLTQADIIFADGFKLISDISNLAGKKSYFLSTTRTLTNVDIVKPNLDKRKKHFLFIGRYHKNKGIDILLQSISILDDEIKKQSHFHIFGGGPIKKELAHIIDRQNLKSFVTLNGYADNITSASYLSSCDALIIPSRIESIPVVLSDALQLGCHLIVTDTGDMGDIVQKYQAGIVAKAGCIHSLKEAIQKFHSIDTTDYTDGMRNLYQLFNINKNISFFQKKLNQSGII